MEKIKSGVYCVINLESGKPYVGSAINFRVRKNKHFSDLRLNKHGNTHLQNSYNYYEKENFIFEIIEHIEKSDEMSLEDFKFILLEREDYWINFLKANDSDYGYNIRKKASSNLGTKWTEEQKINRSGENNPLTGIPLSDEQKQKISDNHADVSGENNPFYGKTHTPETIKRILKAREGKYLGKNSAFYGRKHSKKTKQQISDAQMGINNSHIIKKEIILQIKELLDKDISRKDILKIVPVSLNTIRKVAMGFYEDIYGISGKFSENHTTIISKEVILKIKDLLNENTKIKDIVKILGISASTIHRVKNGYYKNVYGI